MPFTRPNKRDRLVLSVGEAVRHDLMQTFSELRDSETNIRDMSPISREKEKGGRQTDRQTETERQRQRDDRDRDRQKQRQRERETCGWV